MGTGPQLRIYRASARIVRLGLGLGLQLGLHGWYSGSRVYLEVGIDDCGLPIRVRVRVIVMMRVRIRTMIVRR